MLPFKSLDTDTFSQIVERARRAIQIYDSGWTDENYHDPGITFIELFSWLKEMQQFYIDQVGFGNYGKYIKLLGGRVNHVRPAYAKADIISRQPADTQEIYVIPAGTRAYADNMVFETSRPKYINLGSDSCPDNYPDNYPGAVWGVSNSELLFEMERGKRIKCYPFGQDLTLGGYFTIYTDKPLAAGYSVALEIEVFDDYPVKRNKTADVFFELAKLRWEIYTDMGWETIEVKDNTHGFIISGSVEFIHEKKMAETDNGCYGIRCMLEKEAYDVAPLITNIGLNTIELRQTHTISEEINIGAEGNKVIAETFLSLYGSQEIYGLKGDKYIRVPIGEKKLEVKQGKCIFTMDTAQEYDLWKIISYEDSFTEKRIIGYATGMPYQEYEIPLEEGTVFYDRFNLATVGSEQAETEILTIWQKVEDFDGSTRYDRHYILDEETGSITFGDGINGLCPKGTIIITSYSITHGKNGNVKANQISRLEHPDCSLVISNRNHAHGGADRESYSDGIFRLRSELGSTQRAVTKQDYEKIVRSTPGLMIENVIAYAPDQRLINQYEWSPNSVVIAVKPYGEEGNASLSKVYTRNILANLDKYRLLGTEIIVQPPEYVGIEIYIDLHVKEYYLNAREAVESRIRSYFAKEYSGFGVEIQFDSVYGIIDTHDAVKKIEVLMINARGNNIVRKDNGNLLLPANGLGGLRFIHFTVR